MTCPSLTVTYSLMVNGDELQPIERSNELIGCVEVDSAPANDLTMISHATSQPAVQTENPVLVLPG